MKIAGIYALCEKSKVKYIGQSKDIAKRFSQHCSIAQNQNNTPRQKWLRSMLMDNRCPELIILEQTENLDEAEIGWIKKYDGELVNVAKGGKLMWHTRKAKLSKPWGAKQSPLQRRLIHISQTIKCLKRLGHQSGVEHLENLRLKILDAITRTGKDELNNRLWLWEQSNG